MTEIAINIIAAVQNLVQGNTQLTGNWWLWYRYKHNTGPNVMFCVPRKTKDGDICISSKLVSTLQQYPYVMKYRCTLHTFKIVAKIQNAFLTCVCSTALPQARRLLLKTRRLLPRIRSFLLKMRKASSEEDWLCT